MEFAEQAVQANLQERTAEAERVGLENGFKKGIEEGLEKGLEKGFEKGKRTFLQTQIIHRYKIEDSWVNSLSDQQIDDAVILILECDTYDDLKEKLRKNERK